MLPRLRFSIQCLYWSASICSDSEVGGRRLMLSLSRTVVITSTSDLEVNDHPHVPNGRATLSTSDLEVNDHPHVPNGRATLTTSDLEINDHPHVPNGRATLTTSDLEVNDHPHVPNGRATLSTSDLEVNDHPHVPQPYMSRWPVGSGHLEARNVFTRSSSERIIVAQPATHASCVVIRHRL
ncbi:hypothetical protein RRG08_042458 [Elysia crispata]|uniref:Uncharacterized protein n=1 Tax=Elysia crispata TaxID=231223 RepID=A0AAE1DE85_9GAST|nr:hypothetical protein RRG08_042458 [Elysia crispata]